MFTSDAYDKFNKIIRLGRGLKEYINETQYQFYLEDIIKLRLVWDFLYLIETENGSNTHVTFSHFLRYKATHFGSIASQYKEPPPYQRYTKTTPTSSMDTPKAPGNVREYNPTPPSMIWSEHNPPNPHFEIAQKENMSNHKVPDSSLNSFPQPSLNNGKGDLPGHGAQKHHSSDQSIASEKSFHSSYAPTKSFDHFPNEPSVRSYAKMSAHRVAKSRTPMNYKITWDGHRQTFDSYKNKVEGHLLQVGAGYITDQNFLDLYAKQGVAYFHEPSFFENHSVSVPQAKCDNQ